MGQTKDEIAVLTQPEDTELPVLTEYENKAIVLRERVALVKITNDDEFLSVANTVLEAASNIKALEAQVEPLRLKRYNALQRVYDIVKSKIGPFKEIKEKGSRLTALYQSEKEQARKREEERLRQEEFKKAQELQALQAEQLAKEGRVEEGLEVLESIPEPSPIVAPISTPKVSGISAPSYTYKAKVTNLVELVKAVAEGKAPLQALGQKDTVTKIWDITTGQKFLDTQAESFREAFNFPGCELVKDVKRSSVRAK